MTTAWDFSERTVFVAGGTSGINRGIAVGFAKAGAAVGVLSRSEEKVTSTVAELESLGVQAAGFAADVRDAAAVNEALASAAGALGPFDVLVSGAAGNFPAPALGMSEKGFRSVVDIDLVGTFNVTRGSFEHLKKPGRVRYQHLGTPSLCTGQAATACLCGQGRRRHGDPRAGDGMGRLRHSGQLHRARAH